MFSWMCRRGGFLRSALLGALLGLALPASAAPQNVPAARPGAPATSATPASGLISPAPAPRPALPRQFTIELGPEGRVFADGARLSGDGELDFYIRRAASSRAFAGAVIFADLTRDAQRVQEVFVLLQRAGLVPVRSIGRIAPAELGGLGANPAPRSDPAAAPHAVGTSPGQPRNLTTPSWGPVRPSAAPTPAGSSSRQPAATRPAAARPGRAPQPRAEPVELMTVGLHAAGSFGAEPNRRRLVRLLEKNFVAFRRCHALANPHSSNASFGVDLLIPKRGGSATLQQTRTRLVGNGFQACMQRAFQAIVFEPPSTQRPETISYSLLFKPTAP
jgi:hypothetical protein